ncbi:MAG: RsmB/NOP family class I SAM-dependent RNA methyltransferase, partial [Clostridia bacterium]|nr:RsmB/NOP family class I SAM-dependent RNA methyltransferase [Clostridia bacterium]
MKDLLGDGLSDYLAAMERPPVRGLRLNPLKGERPADARLLAGAGLSLSPVAWEEGAFVFAGAEHIGASPLHHAGAFYIQEPSAMLPVACLPLSPGMRVLDLCAAPGGKSAQLAARIGETGLLVSNEIDRRRCDVLLSNLERMGARNAVVTNTDAATLAGAMPDYFDAVVVDAPCSGEGMFRK